MKATILIQKMQSFFSYNCALEHVYLILMQQLLELELTLKFMKIMAQFHKACY